MGTLSRSFFQSHDGQSLVECYPVKKKPMSTPKFFTLLIFVTSLFMGNRNLLSQDLFGVDPGRPAEQDDPVVVRPTPQPSPVQRFQVPEDLDQPVDQAVVVRDRFAGWEQAGPSENGRRLSRELRSNWIMTDINGAFSGRVAPQAGADLENLTVFLLSTGRVVKETRVEVDGFFEFTNVDEGPYAIVGWGNNSFFAFGLIVLEYDEDIRDRVSNSLRVTAFQNETTINTDWIQHFSPRVVFRVFGRYLYGEGDEDPARLYGIQGISRNLPEAQLATSLDSRPVTRTASGGVLGRVRQMNSITGRPVDLRSTRVILMQNDDVIAATDADNYGVFFFPQVPLGQYGLAAAGADGVGLIAIEVSDSELEMDADGEINVENGIIPVDFTLVSPETIGWLNNYASELAYRRNLLASQERRQMKDEEVCADCEGTGCEICGGTGLCTSRSQSFEDWAANCLGQQELTKLGSGYILSEASKDLRRGVNRTNRLFENAFYGASGGGATGAFQQQLPGGVNPNFNSGGQFGTSGGYFQGNTMGNPNSGF